MTGWKSAGMKRVLLIAAAFSGVALLTVAALPVLQRLYAMGWIQREHFHIVFAALCILPAAAVHCGAAHAGWRGSAWWTVWLPGIAVFAAFPWQGPDGWRALWIFGHAWDWGRTIFLHWDAAPSFVFNSFGAFVTMLTAAIVAFGKLWLGAAKAVGRLGPGSAAEMEDALPSAAWAARSEIVDRFSVPGGIVLGELTDPTRESPDFAPERPRSWGGQGHGRLITMSPTDGNGHVLVTSQASGYKSTGLVIPNILTYDKGPVVVFDPKCELYARCREAREAMNYTPVVIDENNGFDPARLIATLAADHPSAYRRMARMMIPKGYSGVENGQFFKEAAISLFTALLGYHGERGTKDIIQAIARLLAKPPDKVYEQVAQKLKKSKLPFVKNHLSELEGMDERFWGSIKTEITNNLMFSEMPDIERYVRMKKNSKLPAQILDPRCDIFLNIPQNVAEDFAPMLRLMLGSMLTAAEFIEVNEDPSARRLFLIDEAAKLGNMDILENIRDRGRSRGLHLMLFYQTPGEIERLWGRAGMTSWRDGCSATIMGPVSSRTTAGEISAMIGKRIVRVRTGSTSSSSQVLSMTGGSVSTSEQEQLRDVPVISPTEISQLPPHASIITATGRKPILASKAIWFTRKDMKGRVRSTKDIRDELAVTKTQKALMKRLAEMTQPVGDAAAAAQGPAGANPEEAQTGSGDAPREDTADTAGLLDSETSGAASGDRSPARATDGGESAATAATDGDAPKLSEVGTAEAESAAAESAAVVSHEAETGVDGDATDGPRLPAGGDEVAPPDSETAVDVDSAALGAKTDPPAPQEAEAAAADLEGTADEPGTTKVRPEAAGNGADSAPTEQPGDEIGPPKTENGGHAGIEQGSPPDAEEDEESPTPAASGGETAERSGDHGEETSAPPAPPEVDDGASARKATAEEPEPSGEKPEAARIRAGPAPTGQSNDVASPPETGGGSTKPENGTAGGSAEDEGADVPASGGEAMPPARKTDPSATQGTRKEVGGERGTAEEWSDAEAKRFMGLVQDEMSLAEIASDLGRSLADVEAWSEKRFGRGLFPGSAGRASEGQEDDGPGGPA